MWWHKSSACRRLIKTKISYPPLYMNNIANCDANTWFKIIFITLMIKFYLRNIIWCLELSEVGRFLIYQLQTVMYWITVAFTDNGEWGFDSGESAWEFALTAKVGSRSENFSNERSLKRWLTVLTSAISCWLRWNICK